VGLRRHEDHSRNAAVDRKRQAFNEFFVGHYAIFARWQYAVDTLELKRLLEHYSLSG
jgi:hypothetical protein